MLADFPAACVTREALTSLFETLSSYFPITRLAAKEAQALLRFQPPKGDKVGITGDDLRHALSEAQK